MSDASRPEIRILLVDDQPLFRRAIATLIGDQPGLVVAGEADNGLQGLELARTLKPDVVLMDVEMPVMDGVEATRRIREELPGLKVVILTVSEADDHLFDAIRYGAAGYLTKDMTPEALVRSIRGARDGDLPMPRKLAAEVIGELVRGRGAGPNHGVHGLSRLTARESEVLRMIANGLTDREAADSLGISVRTVETHVSNLLHKLGVRNRAEAARIYRERD